MHVCDVATWVRKTYLFVIHIAIDYSDTGILIFVCKDVRCAYRTKSYESLFYSCYAVMYVYRTCRNYYYFF